jgi:ribosome-binding factor A
LPIKRVPELRFFYDDHLDNVRKIDSIIDEID